MRGASWVEERLTAVEEQSVSCLGDWLTAAETIGGEPSKFMS